MNKPTAGPNYTNVPTGSFLGIRWATFSLGVIKKKTSVSFTINGAVSFTGNPLETGIFELYVFCS